MKKIISLLFITLGIINLSFAQDTEESPLSISGDIVSNFAWRGSLVSPTLNFQPTIDYSSNNFSFGLWGISNITGTFKEMDIYASYSINGFSAIITDYYWNTDKRYFNYKNSSTGHVIDVGLSYENENFPLNISVSTMLYGEDKKSFYDITETDTLLNNYSTYLQLSYTFEISENSLNIFAGASPFTGMYGKNFAVVFAGFTVSKEIKITDNFSLPIFATFAVNPQTEDFFATLGISL